MEILFMDKEKSFCREQIGVDPEIKAFRVLIRSPKRIVNPGGLTIPDSVLEREMAAFNIGLVLKHGPLAFTQIGEAYQVPVGTWVWYSKYEREDCYIPNLNCYIINDDRILAAVNPDDLNYLLTQGKAGKYE